MVLSLGACKTTTLSGRTDIAEKIALEAGFKKHALNADPFVLTGYKKIQEPGNTIHVYIEGDGLAWLSRTQPSLNPTPTDPFALKLARQDRYPNVIYLARPCQYSGRLDGQPCQSKYWRSARYAPEVIQSYNIALDKIKAEHRNTDFHLIGYSGGATITALLTSQRDDISSFRSVAGNLDHREHSRHHNVSVLSNSLNPPNYSASLSNIPQYHFIGGDDDIVPPSIYKSYASAFDDQSCLNYKILDGKSHVSASWHYDWPRLLSLSPKCQY